MSPFKARAAEDWERILLARARELRVGGRLLIVNFTSDPEGQCLGNTKETPVKMYDEMHRQWAMLAKNGRIKQAEVDGIAFPNYYRTTEECTEPLTNPESPVYRAGLRLVHCFTRVVPCPYRASWLASGATEKRTALDYARDYVLTLRTWSNATFEAAMFIRT